MAFSGQSTNTLFTPNLIGEDVSDLIRTLSPYEAPILDWLGDAATFATSTDHNFVEDFMRPRTLINSTAIASSTANEGIQINGVGLGLTVGTILENTSVTPERMQVVSIAGANSVLVSKNYDGAATGSLAPGGTLQVRVPTAEEGHEHSGAHTGRQGNRRANTVGYFSIEIAETATAMAVNQLGNDAFQRQRAKLLQELPAVLEAEVLTGVLNGTNSLGTSTATRTMQGIRAQLTAINSSVVNASFTADPHLYIGDVMQETFDAGAATTESWGIVAGSQYFRDISNLNDTKVQDSNAVERFKRVIRNYEGPFGNTTVFLSRALAARELMIIPRERIAVAPLQGRNFVYQEMGRTGDNVKGMFVGEYTVEVHHPDAMGRLRTTSPV